MKNTQFIPEGCHIQLEETFRDRLQIQIISRQQSTTAAYNWSRTVSSVELKTACI
jgi:hypothetical protein